ncbi:MAG TPA: hypothetical protein PKM88_04040, partial [bacterium]|nr:hypothetical protein [bacterium]
HPAVVGVIIAAMAGLMLAMVVSVRRQSSSRVRAFVTMLKKWPDNTNAELYDMINFAHTISQQHLESYGVSRAVLRNFAEFYQRYHDAITHPFIYDRERLLRAMAFIAPDMPVHLIEHEEEQLTRIDHRAGDTLTLRLIGWQVKKNQKLRLKFVGKERLLKFKAKVLDPEKAVVQLYAYRSETQRHYARIRVPAAALILQLGGEQRELPVLDMSIKSFLCRSDRPVPEGEIPAALRLPAAPLYKDFTVTRFKDVAPGQSVFVITRIAQPLQESLIQYVFDYQHRH